jgi:hypothetical protein
MSPSGQLLDVDARSRCSAIAWFLDHDDEAMDCLSIKQKDNALTVDGSGVREFKRIHCT